MTKPRRYRRFSSEFKREALMRASEEGITDKAVCDELGVSTRQFRRWRDELALLDTSLSADDPEANFLACVQPARSQRHGAGFATACLEQFRADNLARRADSEPNWR